MQLVSDAESEGPVKSGGSMKKVGKGVAVGVREVSKPKQLRGKEKHFLRVCILFLKKAVCLTVLLSLTCACMHRVCVCAAQCVTEKKQA